MGIADVILPRMEEFTSMPEKMSFKAMEDDLVVDEMVQKIRDSLSEVLRLQDFVPIYEGISKQHFGDPSVRPMLLQMVDAAAHRLLERLANRAQFPRDIDALISEAARFPFNDLRNQGETVLMLKEMKHNHPSWL